MISNPIIDLSVLSNRLSERKFTFNGDNYMFFNSRIKRLYKDKEAEEICRYDIIPVESYKIELRFSPNEIFKTPLILLLAFQPENTTSAPDTIVIQ